MADNLRLVFLVGEYFEEGKAIRGAALVTDAKTRPIEFRCTSPVRPNNYQRILYGETLEEYIFVDLIGVPLVTSTREELGLVLVEDARFLAARPSLDVPVILLARPAESTDVSEVTLTAHRRYTEEEAGARERLSSLFEDGRDLLEPFERLRVALSNAHAQGIGERVG